MINLPAALRFFYRTDGCWEINNELRILISKEHEEIERILQVFSRADKA